MQHNCDLTRCFLCTHCVPEWKEVIALSKHTLLYKKGQPIFTEGDKTEGIFFVYNGAVKVHQPWGTDKELILTFATTGDVLGYRGQGPGIYPVSATPLVETTACFVTQSLLEATFRANTHFLYRMMQLYADALHAAERRMRLMALSGTRQRIADALLTIRDTFGCNAEGYIGVPVTRQDIASYAGTTYETVFKSFTEWTTQGLLDTTGKFIRLLDEAALKDLVDVDQHLV